MKKYNTLFLPFFICFVLFCFVFVSLIGSNLFYEKQILVTSICIIFLWGFFFIRNEIKINDKRFSRYTTLIVIGIFLGFYYASKIWFSSYLNLFPIESYLNGNLALDTSYLTDVAESFRTNGYPSIMMNDNGILYYHVISNLIFSCISEILNVPCLVTYCYLYPVIFIPLYVFLLQEVIIVFRNHFGDNSTFCKKDVVFLLCFLLGFNFFSISDLIVYGNDSIIQSESFFVSFVLFLLVLRICIPFRKKNAVKYLLIPFAILFIAGAKISTGLLFALLVIYFLFRTNPKSYKNWLLICLYSFAFVLFYIFVFSKSSNGADVKTFEFLAFLKSYVPKSFWGLHYFFYFIPVLFLFEYDTVGSFFQKKYFVTTDNLWFEVSFLLTIGSWLPGLFFNIYGGSAEYFCIPAFLISCLILWGRGIVSKFFNNFQFSKTTLLCLVFLLLILPTAKKIKPISMIKETVIGGNTATLYRVGNSISGKKKLFLCLRKADCCDDERYQRIKEIRSLPKKRRKNMCVYIDKDSWVSYYYKSTLMLHGNYDIRGAYATASVLGLPIINAFYEQDGYLYRWDDERIADFVAYGFESVSPGKKLSQEQIYNKAKMIGRSEIVQF